MTEAAQFQTTIDKSDFYGIAPLHQHYAGQHQPQPAYIRMDEEGQIDTWVNGEIGNATPSDVWHGRTLTWSVPANVRGDALLSFVQEHRPLFERVYLGHEVDWDGGNHVGKLDEDAQEASEEIEKAADALHYETIDVCSMEEWMRAGGNNKLADMWAAGQSIEEAAQEAEESARDALRDGVWVQDPYAARSELLQWAEEQFYSNPEMLSPRHFEALISEGHIAFDEVLSVIEDEELEIGLCKEVNESGVQQIRQFLIANHKRGAELTDDQVKAWVQGVNFQLAEGNTPTVEIGAADSAIGGAISYTLSDTGVSVCAVQH